MIAHQLLLRLPAEPVYLFLVFMNVTLQKIVCQKKDILASVTQGRYMNLNGIDTIKQILTEVSLFHHPVNVYIGGTNQTNINRNRACSAQTRNLPLLYRCQQLGLHRQRKISYFIQKEGPSRSHFHASCLCLASICKCPLLIAEEFALKKGFRNASQVNRHKRRLPAGRIMTKRTRHQVLSRSILT